MNNIVNGGGVKYFHANSTLADSSAVGTDAGGIGGNAQVTTANSVALGSNSVANSTTLTTAGFTPGRAGRPRQPRLLVAKCRWARAGKERRITNVAAGLNATDAVNVSQADVGRCEGQPGRHYRATSLAVDDLRTIDGTTYSRTRLYSQWAARW